MLLLITYIMLSVMSEFNYDCTVGFPIALCYLYFRGGGLICDIENSCYVDQTGKNYLMLRNINFCKSYFLQKLIILYRI